MKTFNIHDDGRNLDIYGSALDDLIKATRSDLTMDSKRFAGEDPAARTVLQAIESGRDTQSTGAVSGDKPVVIHAGEGSKVFLHTNGNKWNEYAGYLNQ